MSRLGLGRRRRGATPPLRWRSRGLIAARMSEPFAVSGAYAADGASSELYDNSRHVVAVTATNPSVVFHNVRNGTDGPAFTVSAIWGATSFTTGPSPLDYEVMTWANGTNSGSRSPSITAGNWLESQAKAVTGLSAGNLLMTRHHQVFAATPANWLGNELSVYQGDEVGEVGNGLTDRVSSYQDYGHGIYGYPGNSDHPLAGPSLVLGDTSSRTARICIVNDSIGMGAGEGAGGLWIGWPQRLLQANFPWYLVGNQGFGLGALLAGTERSRRLVLLDLAGITHVLVQVITNDLVSGTTSPSADFMANLDILQAYLNTLPLKPKVVACTATPRTNQGNTDKYPTDLSTTQAERLTLNAAIRAQRKYSVLDVAAYAQSSTNINLWDTTGSKGTTDGIHPNPATHAAIASGLASGLATAFNTARYV